MVTKSRISLYEGATEIVRQSSATKTEGSLFRRYSPLGPYHHTIYLYFRVYRLPVLDYGSIHHLGLLSFIFLERYRDYCCDLALTTLTLILTWSDLHDIDLGSLKAKRDFKSNLDTASRLQTATSVVLNTAPKSLLVHQTFIARTNSSLQVTGRGKQLLPCLEASAHGIVPSSPRSTCGSINFPTRGKRAERECGDVVEFGWQPLEPPFP